MTPKEPIPRRSFLIDAARVAATGWLTVELQLLAACARDDGVRDRFRHLTAAEGRAMRAFAAQVLPSDYDLPGAEEAGAVYFVDRAFGMPFFAESVPVIRSGLADLDARARSANQRQDFASASSAERVAIMRTIETTPFFVAARALVIIGTLADPSYGGNRGGAGWSLLDIDHRPSHTAPFGWYDTYPVPGAPQGSA